MFLLCWRTCEKAGGEKSRPWGSGTGMNCFSKEEFEHNGKLYIATEDGSVGTKGNVMDAIREHGLEADVIFACGPTPMLRALKAYAWKRGFDAGSPWRNGWPAV